MSDRQHRTVYANGQRFHGVEQGASPLELVTVRDGKVADVEVFYWDQAPILDAAAVAS